MKVEMQFLASLLLRGVYFFLLRQKSKKHQCFAAKYRSASNAAMQPVPAAVIA
jgi:hypothetical protein